MAKLIYFTPTSLDLYIGINDYDWSGAPSDEVMRFINDLMRPVGTSLYGRAMYETMAVWQTPESIQGMTLTEADRDFAQIWQTSDKIVYSRTLESVWTPNTRLEREFDADAVRELKAQSPKDLAIGGPILAGEAFRAGLVDEIRLLIWPVLLGGGRRILPEGVREQMELLEERRFADGTVYLRWRRERDSNPR